MKVSDYKKMTPEQLQQWLQFRNKASRIENKKGKGSYRRKKEKFDF